MTDIELLELFKNDVCLNKPVTENLVNADYFDVSLGYFLGKGADLDQATRCAELALYRHEYWKYWQPPQQPAG